MGHSLGAALGLEYLGKASAAEEKKLAGFVAVSLPLRLKITKAAVVLEAASPLLRSFWAFAVQAGLPSAVPAFGPYKRHQFPIRSPQLNSDFSYFQMIENVLSTIADQLPTVHLLNVPGLALYGAIDRIATARDGDLVSRQFQQMDRITLPWENHYTTLLAARTAVEVVEWIKSRTKY